MIKLKKIMAYKALNKADKFHKDMRYRYTYQIFYTLSDFSYLCDSWSYVVSDF